MHKHQFDAEAVIFITIFAFMLVTVLGWAAYFVWWLIS